MAEAYVGVGGVPRRLRECCVGVGGAARTVKEIYVGVGGVPRLAWRNAHKYGGRWFEGDNANLCERDINTFASLSFTTIAWHMSMGAIRGRLFTYSQPDDNRFREYEVATKALLKETVQPGTEERMYIGGTRQQLFKAGYNNNVVTQIDPDSFVAIRSGGVTYKNMSIGGMESRLYRTSVEYLSNDRVARTSEIDPQTFGTLREKMGATGGVGGIRDRLFAANGWQMFMLGELDPNSLAVIRSLFTGNDQVQNGSCNDGIKD